MDCITELGEMAAVPLALVASSLQVQVGWLCSDFTSHQQLRSYGDGASVSSLSTTPVTTDASHFRITNEAILDVTTFYGSIL